jgi:PAS domain S-box-containing protein
MIPIDPPAIVEVNDDRRYVAVNDSACRLLGYSREEFLQMRIDDLAVPSGAHVPSMYQNYLAAGAMEGIFAVKRKRGDAILIRFKASILDGRAISEWIEYEPLSYRPAVSDW